MLQLVCRELDAFTAIELGQPRANVRLVFSRRWNELRMGARTRGHEQKDSMGPGLRYAMTKRDELREFFCSLVEALDESPMPADDARDRQEELAHAQAYEDTAGVLERRAARKRAGARELAGSSAEGSDEHERIAAVVRELETQADEETRRAEDFRERARIVRTEQPMPRRLRTPMESLDLVDGFRHVLVDMLATLEVFDDLAVEEFKSFLEAAKQNPDTAESLREGLAVARVWVVQSLVRLGATIDGDRRVHFAPFRTPLQGIGLPAGTEEITITDEASKNGV